ncbi:MAG: hypothetical protein J6R95_05225, partial [Bacteroidales bacterium]|nr:hypothetical protein [Bacteroidales bacterium]
ANANLFSLTAFFSSFALIFSPLRARECKPLFARCVFLELCTNFLVPAGLANANLFSLTAFFSSFSLIFSALRASQIRLHLGKTKTIVFVFLHLLASIKREASFPTLSKPL